MSELHSHENKTYPVKKEIVEKAHINNEQYLSLYQQSIKQPEIFWAE